MTKCRVVAALLLALLSSSRVQSAERINVLMIVADDMNTWLLGDPNRYTGKVVAPNIRSLAASGVNFRRAYTAAPVCSPSRTAFFSGASPWRSGHYHNALQTARSKPLDESLSMAGAFKKAGYTTIGYGKITHGWDQKQHWDVKVGHKRDPAPPGAPLTSVGRGEQDWGPIHLAESDMNGTRLADLTIESLGKKHRRPFFLACGFFNPHMPWYVLQKYFDQFPLDEVKLPSLAEDDLDDVPELGVRLTAGKGKYVDAITKAGLHAEGVRAYLATTAYVDAQVGRVLGALEKSPYAENTLVVFLSDHGFHLGEKHHWQKATLWEEATHCLLMFRVPGTTRPGGVCERFVSLQDLYPTLVELCELKRTTTLDGRSLVPLLENPRAAWTSTALTALSDKSRPRNGYITIRSESGRYTRYENGQEEFYDAGTDPHEWTNQIANPKFAKAIEHLRAAAPPLDAMATPLPPVQRGKRGSRVEPKLD